ncbi:MAG: M23/M56 family metallopeptidase [Spirochaetales bacterium]|nr:M23/M56 family metallopeptidase [Spirochaetales bacterium]
MFLVKYMFPWGFFSTKIRLLQRSFEVDNTTYGFGIDGFDSEVIVNTEQNSNIIFAIWLSVFFIFLLIIFRNLLKINRQIKRASFCNDSVVLNIKDELSEIIGLNKKILIRVSDQIMSPVLWWDRNWVVVIPVSVLDLEISRKKIILAHELMHIRKHDFAKFLLLQIIKSFFFFSPFVNYVIKEIFSREETETDLLAISKLDIPPVEFGETILFFAGLNKRYEYQLPSLAASKKNRLKSRIERLFQKKACRKLKIGQNFLLLMTVLVFLINFSSTAFGVGFSDSKAMINPLPTGRITLDFGTKIHPITKKKFKHEGIDLAAPVGTPVFAADTGTVTMVDLDEKMGKYIVLQHEDEFQTVYAHLDETSVKVNSKIIKGNKIGTGGNTGQTTGAHLHFEIRKSNKPVDPAELIKFE